jgi:hypothetical protein
MTKKIRGSIAAAEPEYQNLFKSNVQIASLEKLKREFKTISAGASVALVNATDASARHLERLKDILSVGPAESLAGLNKQAEELRRILKSAEQAGADVAIRPVEAALRAVIERLVQGGPAALMRNIAQETARSSDSIRAAGTAFATAVGTVVPAAREFVSIVTEGFDRLNDKVSSVQVKDTPRVIELRISTGTKRFEIDINKNVLGVTTEDSLDESEIRKIIDEVNEKLKVENDEVIRRLEDELRSR